jgi:hypothetical protein
MVAPPWTASLSRACWNALPRRGTASRRPAGPDRQALHLREAIMRNATATPAIDRLVDVEDLVCPGCDEQVYPEAPQQDAVG